MNSQNPNFDHVEAPRTSTLTSKFHKSPSGQADNRALGPLSLRIPQSHPHPAPENESSPALRQQRPSRGRMNRDSAPTHQSLAPQPNSIPQRHSIPSHSQPDPAPEPYGPDRLFANSPALPAGYHDVDPSQSHIVRFDEAQLAMFAADNAARMASIKDDLTIAAGKVTPGVDDTPYIQYALQALVGNHGGQLPQHFVSSSSDSSPKQYQPLRTEDEEMGHLPVNYPRVGDRLSQMDRGIVEPIYPVQPPAQLHGIPSPVQPARPSSATFDPTLPTSDRWAPVSNELRESIDPIGRTHQPLTYKPRILRPFSMMILMLLCTLMTAALIFSARYSFEHSGLTPYPGSIYSGQYFLFRILPQLLAAIIFMFSQSIVTTSLRVLPFTAMANEDPRERYMALFQKLYPSSFASPQFVGPWQFKVFDVATWLAIFTVPLQSSAFTCIFVHEKWIWAPVQGVVWTLAALYIILLLSTAALMIYWFKQCTGLVWDIRSIGDLLPLLNRSNGMNSYRRNDLTETSGDFKAQLSERWFDRLGYWRTEDMMTGGIWYAIGAAPTDQDPRAPHDTMGKKASNDLSVYSQDLDPVASYDRTRGDYLPWCLRDGPVLVSVAVAALLLLALLVVSFIPQTRLESGFSTGLTAKPNESAFSPANFVYSFVPSFLGMVIFLRFQIIDQALRVLQPWGDFYEQNGSLARRSLLADYAACLPLQSTWRSAKNGHWRVAVVSFLSTLFVVIPVMAGGLFMALTSADGKVRMYPSMPVLGLLLAFLFLYVGGLSLMVPRRRQFLLPHPVTCIAEIISFCSAEELTQDAAFRSVRGREDLEGRLGVGSDDREESVWVFGIVPGRDERRLSIRRMKRFTEQRVRSVRSMV